MELQRLDLLKSLSKLTEEQEKKYYELTSISEKRAYLIKHNPYKKKK
jgi:hypothetical protein